MKTWIAIALAAGLAIGGGAMAQTAGADTTRQQRMDDAYRNWQAGSGQPSRGAGVSGQATPDDGSRPGWTTGSAKGDLKATGSAVKKAARDTGHAVAEGGRKAGRAAKHAGQKAKAAVTPEPKSP